MHLGVCVLSGYSRSGGGGSTTINTKAHNSCQPSERVSNSVNDGAGAVESSLCMQIQDKDEKLFL